MTVVVIGAAAALALLVILVMRSRKIANQTQYIEALITRLYNNDEDALAESLRALSPKSKYALLRRKRYATLQHRLAEAHKARQEKVTYDNELGSVRNKFALWTEVSKDDRARQIDRLYGYLFALLRCHQHNQHRIMTDVGLTMEQARTMLNALLEEQADELLEAAANGDSRALLKADKLIRDTQKNAYPEYPGYDYGHEYMMSSCHGLYYRVGASQLKRPGNWNDLVARLITQPEPRMFELPEKLLPGVLLRIAAEGLINSNLAQIALVVAYLTQSDPDRRIDALDEIPDAIVAELALTMARLRRDVGPVNPTT